MITSYYTTKLGLEPETITYKNRVEADGGEVIDLAYVDSVYKKLNSLNLLNDLLIWHSPYAGVKKDNLGAYSILFDMSNNQNDFVQATGSLQPITTDGGIDFTSTTKNMKTVNSLGLSGNPALTTIVVGNSRVNSGDIVMYSLGEFIVKQGSLFTLDSRKAIVISFGRTNYNSNTINTKEVYSVSKDINQNVGQVKGFVDKSQLIATLAGNANNDLLASHKGSIGTIIGLSSNYNGILWDMVTFTKDLTLSNQRAEIEDLINSKNTVY